MEVKYEGRTYKIYYDEEHGIKTWEASWRNYSAESGVSAQQAVENCHEMIEESFED